MYQALENCSLYARMIDNTQRFPRKTFPNMQIPYICVDGNNAGLIL